MIKKLSAIVAAALLLAGCNWLPSKQPAALKINTVPNSTVFIDGKHTGTTPFMNEKMTAGEITVKLVPEGVANATPWEGLVELTSGVVTVINHEFATDTKQAAGEILTLQPNNQSGASLSVVSIPDAAVVRLDGESKGFTPLALDQLSAGEHQLVVSSPGYTERSINVKTQTGFRLTVSVQLAKESTDSMVNNNDTTPEASGSAEASPAAKKVSPTPTVKGTATPTPKGVTKTPTPTKKVASGSATLTRPYVKINDTPTGYLNVRAEPSVSAEKLTQVNPGETYPMKSSQSGWYEIEYESGKTGWIAGQYAEKYE